jgi:hypothetical protein
MASDDEAVRYREAALLTLGQLDWCVEYLRSIHKNQIADRVAQNRRTIMRRLDANGDGEVRARRP